jgi:hypothetical protein
MQQSCGPQVQLTRPQTLATLLELRLFVFGALRLLPGVVDGRLWPGCQLWLGRGDHDGIAHRPGDPARKCKFIKRVPLLWAHRMLQELQLHWAYESHVILEEEIRFFSKIETGCLTINGHEANAQVFTLKLAAG